MERNYRVIKSEELSTYYEWRYVVVSTETGEVLDDAQGYGYRSARNAYAAYGYKNQTPKQKKKRKKEYGVVREWVKANKDAFHDIENILIDGWFHLKKCGEDVTYEEELAAFEQLLAEKNLVLPEGITLKKAYKLYAEILSKIK